MLNLQTDLQTADRSVAAYLRGAGTVGMNQPGITGCSRSPSSVSGLRLLQAERGRVRERSL